MEFIHYSSNKEIPLGSVIFSEQNKGSTFKRFYAIYKKVMRIQKNVSTLEVAIVAML